jgi:hypothetical protein
MNVCSRAFTETLRSIAGSKMIAEVNDYFVKIC